MKQDKRICDNCQFFEVHPSGVCEECKMNDGLNIDQYYYEQRRDGLKQYCKAYKSLNNKKGA